MIITNIFSTWKLIADSTMFNKWIFCHVGHPTMLANYLLWVLIYCIAIYSRLKQINTVESFVVLNPLSNCWCDEADSITIKFLICLLDENIADAAIYCMYIYIVYIYCIYIVQELFRSSYEVCQSPLNIDKMFLRCKLFFTVFRCGIRSSRFVHGAIWWSHVICLYGNLLLFSISDFNIDVGALLMSVGDILFEPNTYEAE